MTEINHAETLDIANAIIATKELDGKLELLMIGEVEILDDDGEKLGVIIRDEGGEWVFISSEPDPDFPSPAVALGTSSITAHGRHLHAVEEVAS